MIRIFTLGDFDITLNDYSIMKDIGNKKQLIKLFKYFLIHKEIKLLPEKIIEDLWEDESFKNPISMLRTQVSRLRKLLDEDKFTRKPFFTIQYINGYYIFDLEDDCEVDFIEFQNILSKDPESIKHEIEKDRIKFRNLILSYKGKLLWEEDGDWVIGIRSRFARLYVKGFCCYTEYLKDNLMHNEIIEICESAIDIKPYEEIIHFTFMEALVNLKQHSYALIHYEFFTRKLYNDLKVIPSKKLTELYKIIKRREEDNELKEKMDLRKIDNEMTKEFNLGGVMFCNLNYFKFIYNYEKRNKTRRSPGDIGVAIAIVTIFSGSHVHLTEKEIKKGMDSLGYIFLKAFRQGDVVSQWNENQMLVLLYAMREEHIQTVVDKIRNNFNKEKLDERLMLNIKIKMI